MDSNISNFPGKRLPERKAKKPERRKIIRVNISNFLELKKRHKSSD